MRQSKSKGELQKHTLHLHKGDYQRLQELYPTVPAAEIIRAIVRAFLTQIEEQSKSETPIPLEIKL